MSFRIKELRKSRGWTQDHLAEVIGVGKSHVSEMESGKKNPSVPVMEKIAEVFGLHITEIFSASEDTSLAEYLARFDRLSPEGRRKLVEYAELLALQEDQASR